MKVTIITTAFNLGEKIDKCISSLLAQTHKDLEIIIVDDASTDDTYKRAASFKDERITIIKHQRNMGAGQARKTGIEAATGDYIITVDGDDWLGKDFIHNLATAAQSTGADIVSGGITIVWSPQYEEIKRFLPHMSEGFDKFRDYASGKVVFLNNKLVRREMYDIVPYSTRRYCEDTPVILPLLYYANKVAYVDEQGYYYLQHGESLCHKVNQFEQALFKALCSKDCIQFFSDKGEEYQSLISRQELIQYLQILKQTMTPELQQVYKAELGELSSTLLALMAL